MPAENFLQMAVSRVHGSMHNFGWNLNLSCKTRGLDKKDPAEDEQSAGRSKGQ